MACHSLLSSDACKGIGHPTESLPSTLYESFLTQIGLNGRGRGALRSQIRATYSLILNYKLIDLQECSLMFLFAHPRKNESSAKKLSREIGFLITITNLFQTPKQMPLELIKVQKAACSIYLYRSHLDGKVGDIARKRFQNILGVPSPTML